MATSTYVIGLQASSDSSATSKAFLNGWLALFYVVMVIIIINHNQRHLGAAQDISKKCWCVDKWDFTEKKTSEGVITSHALARAGVM